jgi:hypothetical protein
MDFSAHLSAERPYFDELHFRARTAEITWKYRSWLK